MTGIERLRKLSEDVGYTSLWIMLLSGREDDWDCEEYDDKTLDGTLTAIADQIEREREELEKRLMPEGYEWPRYESGEPLRYEDRYVYDGREREVWHVDFDSYGDVTILNKDCSKCSLDKGERVRRPAPKVLDADGAEIHEGDTVWGTNGHGPFEVTRIVYADRLRVIADDEENGHLNAYPEMLTHRAPVLAADGRPLREGETVWIIEDGGPYKVTGIDPIVKEIRIKDESMELGVWVAACGLTHTKPEPSDSWERIEEDAEKDPCGYFGFDGEEPCGKCPASGKNCEQTMAQDLVRRAKKLAERGE